MIYPIDFPNHPACQNTQLQSQLSVNDYSSILLDNSQQLVVTKNQNQIQNKKKFSLPLIKVQTEEDLLSVEKMKARKRWKMLQTVFLSVRRFRSHTVSNIDSPEKLQAEMLNFASSPLKQPSIIKLHQGFPSVVYEFQNVDLFIKLAENGSSACELEMQKILQKNPKKHLMCTEDPRHFINQKNKYGQTALYMACKNGHLNIVKLLLKNGADPHIQSQVYNDIMEDPLSVSVRWLHIDCIEYLLEFVQYSPSHLKQLSKMTQNQTIKQILGSTNSWFCC